MVRFGPRFSRRPVTPSNSAAPAEKPPFHRSPLFETLEGRLLFSATPAVALAADGILALQGSEGADHAVISHAGVSADGGEIIDLDLNGILQRFGDAATGVHAINADLGDGDDLIQMVDLYSKANIIGGAGNDTFIDPNGNQTWNIDGAN